MAWQRRGARRRTAAEASAYIDLPSRDGMHLRVQSALDRVRPYLGSHGGGVSLLRVDDDGVAHLRLEGTCAGCPSSAATVRQTLEHAVLASAPGVTAVRAEEMVEPRGPSERRGALRADAGARQAGTRSSWVAVDLHVPAGVLTQVSVQGQRLVVAGLAGTLVAYQDRCPRCDAPLSEGGVLVGELLRCGCGTTFDGYRAGRPVHDEGAALTPVPLLPAGTSWTVKVELARPAHADWAATP
ncbi:NifU family protein [Nocardioides campestrisoli]|uniref:NifU family protein n=1 Tax=Nocardioides campestrisoli TaxID=2736757 RepID=UPI0015E6AB8E|nr:NifU family protein [Nocardioides campestrisoli]